MRALTSPRLPLLHTLLMTLLLSLFSLSHWGCDRVIGFFGEPQADVTSPQNHSDELVQFQYPGNWEMHVERLNQNGISVITRQVKSYGSAITIVQSFPPMIPIPLDEYVKNFLQGMREELESGWTKILKHKQLEVKPITRKVLGQTYNGRRFNWNIKVLQEEIPFVVEIISIPTSRGHLFLVIQLPVDGLDDAQPGADLIRSSLKLSKSK